MKVSRALVSVSDKTGLEEFARGLAARGVTIISTGGTAESLRSWGIDVVPVDEVTGHPEILDVPIERPVIVVGLPRSGTTHLVNLLATDTRFRSLPWWEVIEPIPVRGDGPGRDGLARDEKWQINRLLGEWLAHCLAEGHALHSAALAADG